MKCVCLVLVIFVGSAHSKFLGLILHILLSSFIQNPPNIQQDEVPSGSVRFFLFTRNNPSQAVELNEENSYVMDVTSPVKFIIHGWLESVGRPWIRNITDEFLKKSNFNVIQVDYSKTAAERYSFAAGQVRNIGSVIGKLIVNLNIIGVPLSNVHIIGHSLGSHVAGAAGKEVFRLTASKISRITALDPAGPLFETPPLISTPVLEKTDADILDVIHTDAGVFGYQKPLGTVDFFPNGGFAVQAGCPPFSITSILFNGQSGLDDLFCSHTKSYYFYISSINRELFVGTNCQSWNLYRSGGCQNNLKAVMGDGYVYTPEATGSFYLMTNPSPPYANAYKENKDLENYV